MKPLLVISLFISSFCLGQKAKIDYIIFGEYYEPAEYYGVCFHYCANMYKLYGDTLLVDTTDSYFKQQHFSNYLVNKEAINIAKAAIDSIPSILINSSDSTFGHPDNMDQGGVFIQIRIRNTMKVFHIDNAIEGPIPLRHYVELIWRLDRKLSGYWRKS